MGIGSRYKQTEVGMIPEDWDAKPLGELGESLIGLTYKPTDVRSDGILVLRSSNIQNGRLHFDDNVFVDMAVPERIMVRAGDILICVRNGSRELIGKCVRLDEAAKGMTFGAFMAVFRTTASRFVHQQFQSAVLRRQIREHLGATINQITNKSLNSFLIPLPRQETEREAISDALSDADALIESLEQLLAKKRQIKQGAMQELLTGKKRLPGFKGEWEVKRLDDVADTDPENLASDTRADFEFNYIALEDVDAGILKSYSLKIFRTAPSRARRRVRKDDVLVSTVRPNLMSHLWFSMNGDSWICSTGFCVVRCREGVSHPGYVYFHMFAEQVAQQINALLTGSNYPAINGEDVRALQIPFPGYEEQAAIATVLSDMDAEIDALRAKVEKARQFKNGMMQQLLTGRVRLV